MKPESIEVVGRLYADGTLTLDTRTEQPNELIRLVVEPVSTADELPVDHPLGQFLSTIRAAQLAGGQVPPGADGIATPVSEDRDGCDEPRREPESADEESSEAPVFTWTEESFVVAEALRTFCDEFNANH